MKRFLGILLSLSLLAAAGGCSAGPKLDANSPVSIEIWHYYNGPQKIQFDQMVSDFNETVGAEKGIVVEAFSQGSVDGLMEKVLDAANKKVGADPMPNIFAAYTDSAYQIDQLGCVAELDAYFTDQELSEYRSSYIEEGRFDKNGTLKIFPVAKSTELLFLNKTDWDAFARESGAKLEALSTMEGLVETAKAYYQWSGGKAFFGWDAVANYVQAGAEQLGAAIIQMQDGAPQVTLNRQAVRKLWDAFYVPMVNGWFGAFGRFRSDDAKTGDLLALIGSTTSATYFPQKVVRSDGSEYPIQAEVLPPPVFAGADKVTVQQGAGMVVVKSDQIHEFAASIFLKWFTEKDRNLDFCAGSGYLPVKNESTDLQTMEGVLDRAGSPENLKKAMPVALKVVDEYKLFVGKAYAGSNDVRKVYEAYFLDQAKECAQAVAALTAGGMPRQQALAGYTGDAAFEKWYMEFASALEAAAHP